MPIFRVIKCKNEPFSLDFNLFCCIFAPWEAKNLPKFLLWEES